MSDDMSHCGLEPTVTCRFIYQENINGKIPQAGRTAPVEQLPSLKGIQHDKNMYLLCYIMENPLTLVRNHDSAQIFQHFNRGPNIP